MSNKPYETIPSATTLKKVMAALEERNIHPHVVANGKEALEKIKTLIPKGASVMNGSSTSLNQIGFVEYLKTNKHGWKNLHEAIVKESDPEKQMALRKQSIFADYFLGSVHAFTEDGQLLIASNTGSQLPSYIYSSQNVIWVVGTHKLVPTLNDAFDRLHKYVFPLENDRMKQVGMGGSAIGKILVYERETPYLQRNLQIILVNEQLGF